jgi:hypothetical protein
MPCGKAPRRSSVVCFTAAPSWVLLQKNHLSGLRRQLLRLSFWNVQHLMEVRREVAAVVRWNSSKRSSAANAYATAAGGEQSTRDRLQVR